MLKSIVWGENMLYNVRNDRKGVTAMEYAVIAAVTVLVTAAGVASVSQPLTDLWAAIVGALAVPTAPAP